MIADRLNEEWLRGETSRAVFEVRAALQHLRNTVAETDSKIAEITGSAAFYAVDTEIKTEGQACIQIVKQIKDALDAHSDFLNWDKP